MENEKLEQIIDAVNDGTGKDWIFLRPLMTNVSIARVWTIYPNGNIAYDSGYIFYFIHAESGQCVATISDMGPSNLHVYVKESHRRLGLMTRALHDVVLPHLFLGGRKEQKATFESEAARGLLEKVGFSIMDKGNAVIPKDRVPSVEFPEIGTVPFTEERRDALEIRVRTAAGLLCMASEELMLYPCRALQKKTAAWAEKTDDLATQIVDKWWHLPDRIPADKPGG